jgi:hypothetical protein
MTNEAHSADYEAVLQSIEGQDPDSREGLNTEALLRLSKEERREAEKLLIERIDLDDPRVPPALAEAETRGAVMPMKRHMDEASGRMKVAMALALVKLEALPKADEIVASVLRSGDPDGGMAALAAAEEMRSAEIRDALAWSSVHHPSPDVRAGAGATLFYMAALTKNALAWDFRPIWIRLRNEDEGERRKAFEEICQQVGMPPHLADS